MHNLSELDSIKEFDGHSLELVPMDNRSSRKVVYAGLNIGYLKHITVNRHKETQQDGTKKFVSILYCRWQASFHLDGKEPYGNYETVEEAIENLVKAANAAMKQSGISWT